MAKDHEISLVAKLTGAITKIDVNPKIAHPLLFQPIVLEMDTWHKTNKYDFPNYLKKLDAYTLQFYERTQNEFSDFDAVLLDNSSAFICTECFGPHNIKDCNKHENNYESEEINDQESENDDAESDEQHSEYENEIDSTQYNEM